MRSSVVDVLNSPDGFWYFVVSPGKVDSTFVITVDVATGNPFYTGVPFVDIFPDHSMALKSLSESGAKKVLTGLGLIGLVSSEGLTTVAIISKAEVTGILPGGHKVYTILDTAFVNIQSSGCQLKNSLLEEFQLNNNHFYCESYDMTRLFPNTSQKSDDGFVWNNGWKKPFVKLRCADACIDLIQGVCKSSSFRKFNFQITYIARRSVLNPGTRYAARGLNDLNSPGNEVECELIFVRDNKFWSVRWRRGSIPIRWKTTLTSAMAAPQHRVDANYFQGTQEYFQGIQERFGDDIDIRCVSLLQTESDHSEGEIKSYFVKAVGRLFDAGIDKVFYTPFDLNHHLHSDGSNEAMMDFVSFIGPLAECDGFNIGTLPCTVEQKQRGLMRFNCADSLDRTNLATFYFAMKITAEWCIEQKIGVVDANADRNLPNKIIHQEIIDFLAVSFVDSGNVVSYLYTNTPAIKVKAIRSFSSIVEKQSSDTSVTMQRRLQNVVNDPQRMKVIELWTNPPDLKWFHRVDPRHIFVVPTGEHTIPRCIMSASLKPLMLRREQNELLLCLPCPMQLFSIMILLYPSQFNESATNMHVSIGMTPDDMQSICSITLPSVQTPLWCRYKLLKSERWAIGNNPFLIYGRFVQIKFEVPGERYCIGNIKLETRSVFCGNPDNHIKTLPVPESDTMERYKAYFDAFFMSKSTHLRDILDLEKCRVALRVPETYRHRLALEVGMNPWVADSAGQITACVTPNCGLCGHSFQPNETPTIFRHANILKGMIVKAKDGGHLKICSSCLEFAEGISQRAELYEEELSPEKHEAPHFEPGSAITNLMAKNQAVTTEANAVFLEKDNKTFLWSTGGKTILPAGTSKELTCFIVQQAIALEIIVDCDSPDIRILTQDGTELIYRESTHSYVFPEPPIAQKISFTIHAIKDVEIRRLQILYIVTEYPLETPDLFKHPQAPTAAISPVQGHYTVYNRTDFFRFAKSKFSKFQVEIVMEKGFSVPVSFICATYLENKLQSSEYFILPEAPNGKKLWFMLKEPVVCDSVKIFYTDRVAAMKNHTVRLNLE